LSIKLLNNKPNELHTGKGNSNEETRSGAF